MKINCSLEAETSHSPCKGRDSKAYAESCMLCSQEPTGFLNTPVLSAREVAVEFCF